MRLPDPLYRAVQPLSASHARWHENRAIPKGEPGSGGEFLAHHRGLLAAFEEIRRKKGSEEPSLAPWSEIPFWLSQFLVWAKPGYLAGALGRIRDLARSGSADELGKFLESAPSANNPFGGFHDVAHTMIAIYERHRFGPDHPDLEDAGMGSPLTAPNNVHFWGLHGWIDGLYEAILRRG